MDKIKVGVIGVGYIGEIHAKIFSQLENAHLACVVDIDSKKACKIAGTTGTQACTDFREQIDKVQAVSIATPTFEHYRIAEAFLDAGVDVLVEKPITASVKEADGLIRLAEQKNRILQVGHLERFNGAVQEVVNMMTEPKFIECNRLSSFKNRSTDVDVIMDLMIHDIDIILCLVKSNVIRIQAVGVPVLTKEFDIVNARIQFENGCVANVTASRISMKNERKIRIFQTPGSYISLDYIKQSVHAYHKATDEVDAEGYPKIKGGKVKVNKVEPLRSQLSSFLDSVATRREPIVAGMHGREALRVAEMIQQNIVEKKKNITVTPEN